MGIKQGLCWKLRHVNCIARLRLHWMGFLKYSVWHRWMKQFAPRFPRTPPHVIYKVVNQLHIQEAVNHYSRVTCEPYSAIWSESETTLCLRSCKRIYQRARSNFCVIANCAHIIKERWESAEEEQWDGFKEYMS
jgi:hypothetical protein